MGTLIQFRKVLRSTMNGMQQEDAELSREIDDMIDLAVTSWLKEQDLASGDSV